MTEPHLGISGRIAAAFQSNPLTPLLAILALLLGLAAVLVTPREEEPQIDVTMANVFVPFPGAGAREVEQLVATPLEQKLDQIAGVKHVYSVSRPGMAILTVEFTVGVPRQTALVRLYNEVYSNQDWIPPNAGIGPPLVKPKGIDDVPVMSLTLWTDDPQRSARDLGEVAHTLETELKRIPGTRDIYTIGAPDRVVEVRLDPARLAAFNLSVPDLAQALQAANAVRQIGDRIGGDRALPLTAGTFLASANDVADLVIGMHDGKPVRLQDVAQVHAGADIPSSYVWFNTPAGRTGPKSGTAPAVTIAIAKKSGSNAADITRAVRARLAQLQGQIVPQGVHVAVTRDYGQTATDKALKLIEKLVFATACVVLLVGFTLGRREAIVVGAAVVLTLALTLFASTAMGFTLNRVSLFALIFSIGILVDDAIVIVENIHRHLQRGDCSLREAIPPAVDEVGGPTILATFTVIAALLPMAFVTGLMGPYMRPIPINASAGMLLSLAVAMIVTPWLSLKLLRHHDGSAPVAAAHTQAASVPEAPTGNAAPATGDALYAVPPASRLHRLFGSLLRPFLDPVRGARRRLALFAGMLVLVLLSALLVVAGAVVLKMLPFDNKSEFQVVLDMPVGSTLEDTNAVLAELARAVDKVPEVVDVEGYAGTSAPINFNGLVRQYFLRNASYMGDLQVNLVDKHLRSRQSHAIALALRPALAQIGARHHASVKLVEVPPGPPVLAPLVAEIYGPDYARSQQIARALERRFAHTQGIVDIDTSVEADAPRATLLLDRERAAALGISQSAVTETLAAGMQGLDASYVHDGASKFPRPIRLRLPASEQASTDRLLALRVRGGNGQLVPLSELVQVQRAPWDDAIWHKDLLPVVYVTGDDAGKVDSPLYGMFDLVGQLERNTVDGVKLAQTFIAQPQDTAGFTVKWDGEWQITYETFRDMGIAYAAGMLLIYLLVVAQFRSYLVPLVIMAPIPLTAIGVMPGHALLGAQFTATSMIGMIALAGIIVRNSILLVDFIRLAVASGQPLATAVVDACAVRAKPIALTGVAAMLGALFILDDPIFNGLAVSLIFGILVSTVLTLVVIPLLYYSLALRATKTTIPDAAINPSGSAGSP